MDPQNNFWEFDFFSKFFFIHMKELVEKNTEIGVRGLKTKPSIFQIFLKVQKWTEKR